MTSNITFHNKELIQPPVHDPKTLGFLQRVDYYARFSFLNVTSDGDNDAFGDALDALWRYSDSEETRATMRRMAQLIHGAYHMRAPEPTAGDTSESPP